MNQNEKATKRIEKRKRLSSKEFEELKSQLEAGDTEQSFERMQKALEVRNWTFLHDCALSHFCHSKESSRALVYLGIATVRLGYSERLCNAICHGWIMPPGAPDLAREAAVVSIKLGLPQFSLAFFAIHKLAARRTKDLEHDSPELMQSFLEFLRDAGLETPYKGQRTALLLPYYFTLLIQEIADRIPTPSGSIDRYF